MYIVLRIYIGCMFVMLLLLSSPNPSKGAKMKPDMYSQI